MTKDEAMRLAIDALDGLIGLDFYGEPLTSRDFDGICAIKDLRAALAQPDVPESCFGETKPAAWADKADIDRVGHDFWVSRQKPAKDGIPLYFAPIKKEWVGLTKENIDKAWEWAQKSSPHGVTRIEVFAASIEAKLKEKNCD